MNQAIFQKITKSFFMLLLTLWSLGGHSQSISKFKVVIDAGHGGHDSGAVGSRSYEKDIALNIALTLGGILQYDNHIEVIYTRDNDVFIPLHDRVKIANSAQADLFVSIHCNSVAKSTRARGAETFVMGLHSSKENLDVAKRENAAILLESDYKSNYDGFDPYSIEGHILLAAIQNAHLRESVEIAGMIQDKIGSQTPLVNRGVKQAGFLILRQATMPSILVETAFISHPENEQYLLSQEGILKISYSIAEGIKRYAHTKQETDIIANTNNPVKETINLIDSPRQKEDDKVMKTNPISEVTQMNTNVTYSVQVASMTQAIRIEEHPILSTLDNIGEKKEKESYKYLYGKYENLSEAVAARQNLREKGLNGAFVVAYQGDIRIKL